MSTFRFLIPAGSVAPSGPLESGDLVYGNIGLLGPATVLLHLAEPQGVEPSDAAGNLDDLSAVPGTPAPEVVEAWTGRGRRFTGGGLVAADLPERDTLLVRDVTVQAILSMVPGDIATTGTIVCRGLDGDASELYSFGLELVPHGGDVGDPVDLRWLWTDSTGVVRLQAVGTFEHPGDDEFVLLTATRRWESTTRVVVRYYLGETLLAEHVSTHGDIGGGTTGHTSVGARQQGGTWGHAFAGVLDELKITDYEMSGEEVRETYRRLTVHQPAGVAMMRGLIPPGVSWMRDPSSRIGRLMKVAGQALGFVVAKTEELRATWLPDTAYADRLAHWERLRRVVPRPHDSLDRRRARVVAMFRREAGYSLPAVQAALAELFDQEADDVQIVEFENEVTDGFATLETLRWRLEPPAAWSADAGTLRVQRPIAADLRTPAQALVSLSSGDGEIVVGCKLAAVSSFPAATIVGLALVRFVEGDLLHVGIRADGGGAYRFVMRSRVGGASEEVVLDTLDGSWSPAAPLWLRIIGDPDVPGRYRIGYSFVGLNVDVHEVTIGDRVESPQWAGPVASSSIAISTALDARFDDFVSLTPEGDRPFHWYAYRDPMLPGSPDIRGAQDVVRRMKPAHTHGAAVSSLVARYDDPETGYDREPMGGL